MPAAKRGRPREFDTNAALDAAMELFWKQGYEATSVTQLCEAMGIAKQSMYDWVGDKKALYLAAFEHYRHSRVAYLGEILGKPGSPLANLRELLHTMAEYAKQPDCKGCLLTAAQSEFGTSDPEIGAAVSALEDEVNRTFVDVLNRAQQAGEVPATMDTAMVAGALGVFRNGLMVAGRAGQSAASIDQSIGMIEALLRAR